MIVFVSMKWVLQRTQRKHLHSWLAAVYENNFVQGSVFAGNSWQTRKPWSAEWRRVGQSWDLLYQDADSCVVLLMELISSIMHDPGTSCWHHVRSHNTPHSSGSSRVELITGGELKYFSLWRALYWDKSLSRKLIGKKFPIVAWFCGWLRYQILIRTVLQ